MITLKGGTVLYNKEKDQIALVYRRKHRDLSFPKGHVENNETLEECAVRETTEETGRYCHLFDNELLGILKYVSKREDVEVYMYLAIDDGKCLEESPDPEILVWVDLDEVENTIMYENIKVFWDEAYPIIKKKLKKDE